MNANAAPGSLLRISGSLLQDRTFSIGDRNISLSGFDGGFQFILPAGFPLGTYHAHISSDSAFESALDITVQDHAPTFLTVSPWIHGDFSSQVDSTRPATVGETVVAYISGLGDRQGFTCRAGDVLNSDPVEVLYAGASPYPGIDQVNIRAPKPTRGVIMCGWFPGPTAFAGLAVVE